MRQPSIWGRVKLAIERLERDNAAEREAPMQRKLFVAGHISPARRADDSVRAEGIQARTELRLLTTHARWQSAFAAPGDDGPRAA